MKIIFSLFSCFDKTSLELFKTLTIHCKSEFLLPYRVISWSKSVPKFESEIQNEIQKLAEDINNVLFNPKLNTLIRTLDIPIGGKLYAASTLPLILDFVNISNEITTKTQL